MMQKILSLLVLLILILSVPFANGQNINNPNKQGPLGTQVNTHTGNFFLERNEFLIPARGFNLDISFKYNSYNFDLEKSYGNGWSFEYDIRYSTDTLNGKVITWGNGREDTYKLLPGGAYKAPLGFFNTLSQYQPNKFLLTELDGVKYYFDNAVHKRLTKMEDPNGNFINLNYTDSLLTSLTNAAGQTITFTYNAAGRLATVVDAVATPTRTFSYAYDNLGNLKEVTDPLGGKNKYTYLINGPMKTLADKNNNLVNVIYFADYSASEVIGCNRRISFSYDTTSLTTVVTDHLKTGNQVTTYKYRRLENLAWITNMSGNCCGYNMSYEFDDFGNKIKETDANGGIYTYTNDANGNRLTMTDPQNQTSTFTYTTAFNNLTSVTDPKGNIYTLGYNANGNLTQLVAPGNQIYNATYSPNGDIITSTDPKGNVYTYNYDAFGNPTTVTAPNGYNAVLAYNARGHLLSYTDARGNTHTAEFDILDRLKKITDPNSKTVQTNYDAEGNPISIISKNSEITNLTYDASNRPIKITDAIGNKTEMFYDEMNNLLATKNAVGNINNYEYDTRNRLKLMRDADGNTYTVGYDANGNKTNITMANGQQMVYTYDNTNRLKTVSDNTGTIAQLSYDKNSNVTSYTNGTGAITTATYDSLNRTKTVTDPLGKTMAYNYDKNNNVTSVVDRNGFTKAYTYDSLNRVKTYTDNNGFVITVGYDVQGNIVSAKDQKNNTTAYTYDNLNRLKRTTYPNATYLENMYDVKNNVIAKRLADGTTINFQYDSINRPISKTLPDGVVYTYTYDALGRVLTATNNNGTVTLAYDKLNRVISENYDGRTTRYTYNIAGRSQTTIYPDSTVILKDFDTRNRLTKVSKNAVTIVTYQYNGADQNTIKTFANGVTSTMQYDFANRLSNISTANGAIQNTAFTYDNERNKTAITRANNPTASEQFVYDNGYRLLNYKRGIAGSPLIQNTYTYDAVGNRTSANLNGTNTTYIPNNLNQLTNSNNGTQNINFTYDGRGNLTYDEIFYKTYDADGRLLKDSSAPSNVIAYKYDAFNRRIQKNENGNILKYTYSGLAQIEERNGSNSLLNRTVFTNFLSPVLNEKNGNAFYYHQNELNSVEAISGSNGNMKERYQYDVYGKPTRYDSAGNIIAGSVTGNRIGFTGQEFDSASNSYRFFFRNYSASTGTFNQRDLIGYADGMGMYQYVGNNPANGVDVLGLEEDCVELETNSSTLLSISGKTISIGGFLTSDFVNSNVSSKLRKAGKSLSHNGKNVGKYGRKLGKFGNNKYLKGAKGLGKVMGVADNVLKAGNFAESLLDGETNEQHTEEIQAGGELGLSLLGWTPIGAGFGLLDFGIERLTGDGITTHTANLGKSLGENSVESSDEIFNAQRAYMASLNRGDEWREMHDRLTQREEQYKLDFPCPPEDGTRKNPPKGPNYGGPTTYIQARDPNLIIGPEGEPSKHWVSVKDRLPYTILCENDTSASAPAKYVRITSPIEPKQDAASFQLGSVGFNNNVYTIPSNTASYYQRLDYRDSAGMFVDLTAGYDQINNVAFWEFQSIDPVTLLPPTDPLKGFLFLQDKNNPNFGHGFVNFSIKPKQSAITLDTISAKATIVFDALDTIPTNIYKNTIDAFAPTSHMNALPVTSNSPVSLSWTGADDANGCGIRYYTLYASTDGVNYSIIKKEMRRTDTTIVGLPGVTYCYFVLATDSVGNMEMLRNTEIKCTTVGGVVVPISLLYFNGKTEAKNNILSWATATEQNSKNFELERSLTGNDFGKIASINAAGNSNNPKNYNYTDTRIDKLNSPFMYYRLKQIDINNSFKYSNIVRLNYKQSINSPSIVYPNPTQGIISIAVGDAALIGTLATVSDINGRILQQIKIVANTQSIDMSMYTNGIYFIKLKNKEVLKIIKQ